MANALGRNIEPGEKVVLVSLNEDETLDSRVFECLSGYGMQSEAHGRKIFGRKPSGNEEFWIIATVDIDKRATEEYQKLFPREEKVNTP